MAARIKKNHQQSVREKIRASQLVNYLQRHAVSGAGAENAGTRVRAAAALLNKVLPDLSSADLNHTGKVTLEQLVTESTATDKAKKG